MVSIKTQRTPPITAEQQAFFLDQGYLVVPDIFSDSDLIPVIEEISEQLDQLASEFFKAGKLSCTYDTLDFEHRLAMINRETSEIAKAMWDTNVVLPSFFNLMCTPRLLDLIELFCGPEIIASSVYRLRPKVPDHIQSAVPWHQDSGYFEPMCDKGLVLTVWLPLVNATRENGCLWVLPKAHRHGILTHRKAEGRPYLEITPDGLPSQDAVCCPVPKGGVLLLNNMTPHASFDNTTDAVRWSMDLRYQSAAMPTNARISRLPGEMVEVPGMDAQDERPIACYPPEPDFLIRSQRRPDEVLTTAEQFLELRRSHVSQPVTNRWNAAWESDAIALKENDAPSQ